ncbi:hypothetical protein FDJ19_gp151 [Vibrio phage Ceto]|uniref:Uncharacterized protein n=1 Tax=Vibrio phage Ceto TaxID=2570300 RepID=A0A2H5BGM5_9CAUD|nr:hypothetical protein FDJ19_gp151 [Vibrio phage Ceto]AUG85147.1 hypothetical protein CETO_165 [Vibrio phage Ceto]
MNWRRGAGKICVGVCYFGIWTYFSVVASLVLYYTKSAVLFAATILIMSIAFFGMIDKINRKTKLIYAEMKKQEILQALQDDSNWTVVSRKLRDFLTDEMYNKPIRTIEGLQFKTWYVNRMRGIVIGERIWRI